MGGRLSAAALALALSAACGGKIVDGGAGGVGANGGFGTLGPGTLPPGTLASVNEKATAIAVDANNVYWSTTISNPDPTRGNRTTIRSVPKNGGAPAVVATATTWSYVGGLAVAGGRAYWADGPVLFSVSIDGGPVTELSSRSAGDPCGTGCITSRLALNATSAFWASSAFLGGSEGPVEDRVFELPLAGGTPRTVAEQELELPAERFVDVAIDDANVYIGGAAGIFPAPIGGGPRTTFVYPITYRLAGLAVDEDNVYWLNDDWTMGIVKRTPKNDGSASATTTLARSFPPRFPNGGIVVDEANVYWISSGAQGAVMKVPRDAGPAIDGGLMPALATEPDDPVALAVDQTSVYWVTAGGDVKKTDKTGRSP